jgi:hypothetical protein
LGFYIERKRGLFLIFILLLIVCIIPQNLQAAEKKIEALENNGAKVTDIWQKGQWSFTIRGTGLTDNIKEIRLIRVNDALVITIDKKDIQKKNDQELVVNITGENAKKFSSEQYTGLYDIEIEYLDGSVLSPAESYNSIKMTVKGQNFKEDIEFVELKNLKTGAWEIILAKNKVQYKDENTLILTLDKDEVKKLAGGINASDIEMTVYYGKDYIFDNKQSYFDIYLLGENFNRGVEKVILRPIAGEALLLPVDEQDIIMEKEDISVVNGSKLRVRIRRDNLDKIKEFRHSGDYKFVVVYTAGTGLKDYTASMDLKLVYNYGLQTKESVVYRDNLVFDNKDYITDPFRFVLLSKSSPKVIEVYPQSVGGYPWFNEKNLSHEILKDRNFLKITFEDIDGKLEFNPYLGIDNLLGSSVMAIGSNSDFLDRDFIILCRDNPEMIHTYLFKQDRTNQKAYLYIPVKPLVPQTQYVVNISGNIVRNDSSDNGMIDEGQRYNKPISWEFSTMASPSVSEEGVLVQTVIEGYASSSYIKIYGDDFYKSSVRVFFNDTQADQVLVEQDNNGKSYLKVYLPTGSRRLKAGLYNIIIKNDSDHETVIYGGLSVVEKGDEIPTEGYHLKTRTVEGEVLSDAYVSHDTLYLRSKYSDYYLLELNLDKLMGEEVLNKTVNYIGNRNDYINRLLLKTKDVDATFYYLTLKENASSKEININIGRAKPLVVQAIKDKLKDKKIKSEFIEISTSNCNWDNLYISIPYKNSSGENLSIYRYDEIRRTWTKEDSYTDLINQKIRAFVKKAGIYVVIED